MRGNKLRERVELATFDVNFEDVEAYSDGIVDSAMKIGETRTRTTELHE